MEQMQSKPKKKWLEALLSILAFGAIAGLSKFFIFAFAFLPLPGIYLAARPGHPAWPILYAGCAAAICYWLFPQWFLVLAVFVLVTMAMGGAVLAQKWPSYQGLIACCLACALAAIALLFFVSQTKGMDFISYCRQWVNYKIKENQILAQSIFVTLKFLAGSFQSLSASYEEMLAYLTASAQQETIRQILNMAVPVFLLYLILAEGAFSYLLPRWVLKKRGQKVAFLPRVQQWVLPQKASKYFILMLILGYLPDLLELEQFAVPGILLSELASAVFFVQGVSLLSYLLTPKVPWRAVRILIDLAILLVFPNAFVFMGIFEQFFRVRRPRNYQQRM